MARETYPVAHARLLAGLKAAGWSASGPLKVPYATSPDGSFRYWFKPQAIWFSEGNSHSLNGARSTMLDAREIETSQLLRWIDVHRGIVNRAAPSFGAHPPTFSAPPPLALVPIAAPATPAAARVDAAARTGSLFGGIAPPAAASSPAALRTGRVDAHSLDLFGPKQGDLFVAQREKERSKPTRKRVKVAKVKRASVPTSSAPRLTGAARAVFLLAAQAHEEGRGGAPVWSPSDVAAARKVAALGLVKLSRGSSGTIATLTEQGARAYLASQSGACVC